MVKWRQYSKINAEWRSSERPTNLILNSQSMIMWFLNFRNQCNVMWIWIILSDLDATVGQNFILITNPQNFASVKGVHCHCHYHRIWSGIITTMVHVMQWFVLSLLRSTKLVNESVIVVTIRIFYHGLSWIDDDVL